MIQLPNKLLSSLTEIGLLESEAKIYTALVLLKTAGIKDLLEALDVSKPRIYDGLRMLEENDIIVLTSPRPANYQAIEPKIALELMIKRHEEAKDEALKQFKILEQQDTTPKLTSPIWFIFGAKSFQFKIQDMLKNARETVYCQTSEKYLKYIEKVAKKNIKLFLVIMIDSQDTRKRLEKLSKKNNVRINIIEKEQLLKTPEFISHEKELYKRNKSHLLDIMDLDNLFKLIVDDSELLTIPPLKSDSLSAITSTNEALIMGEKMEIEEALSSNESNK